MTKASDNAYPSVLITEGTEPAAPAAGHQRVYIDSTSHHLSRTDSSGTQVDLETTSAMPDHTHAASGSGATGGGNALDVNAGSLRIPVGTGALTTTEGYVGYQSATERVRVYDGQRERAVSSVGWAVSAYPLNMVVTAAFTSSKALAAAGGTALIVIPVLSHMLLQDCVVRNRDTTAARSWEWRLYVEHLNDGNAGENAIDEVTGANGSESFTASAVSTRVAAATGAPVYLAPGVYILAIRNTHATSTFGLAYTDQSAEFGDATYKEKTLVSALGATLDAVAATWTTNAIVPNVRLRGRVFGQTASGF